jgi:hypothetical protein
VAPVAIAVVAPAVIFGEVALAGYGAWKLYQYATSTTAGGPMCSISGDGSGGGGGPPAPPPTATGGPRDAGTDAASLRISSTQLGHKFGEHRDPARAGYRSPVEYEDLARSIYNDPTSTRTVYGAESASYPGETHYQRGGDLLRVDPNGEFRSLYPIK